MNSNVDLFHQLIAEGKAFKINTYCYPSESGREYGGGDTPEWLAWKTRSINLIARTVSDDSPAIALAKTAIGIRTRGFRHDSFERARSTLLKALQMTVEAISSDAFGELRTSTSTASSATLSNKIFIVHGHDSALKTDVERFVHQIGLEPVVLHRQIDQGQTIIEKFEQHSDVGYALILLTSDEIAYTIDQMELPESERKIEQRARPNE